MSKLIIHLDDGDDIGISEYWPACEDGKLIEMILDRIASDRALAVVPIRAKFD